MPTAVLREFVELVPACALTASLQAVLEQFRHHCCDRLVVINRQSQPLGLLRLQRLLPYWQASAAELAQTLQTLLPTATEPLLEPLLALPIDSPPDQLDLAALSQQQYVLTDTAGHYQGLLDRLRLLQTYSVPHRAALTAPTATPTHWVAPAEPDYQTPALVELLERLPLPLMLQTSGGLVVAQNGGWRQQVGELQNPAEIQQAAAVLLEVGAVVPGSAPCQIGSDANSCVCVCAMKNGQERVWTFVKIPLGGAIDRAVLARRWRELSDLNDQPPQAVSRFQLAALALEAERGSWRRTEAAMLTTDELWLVLAQDTTEQQQVTKELAAKNADLIQLNRLKDEFLACISHELKTPLTAILGLSSLLCNQAMGVLNDRQARYAQLIHQSGRHLILIVNNILDLTRIETGQLTLAPELLNIRSLCTSAYEHARQVYTLSSIDAGAQAEMPQFMLEISPALDCMIADEQRLRQMLTNLLSNALKFTGSEGEIGLRVENWEGWLAFTVWDTGIGIPIDKQHLIFQKFQQLENPLTRRFEGTGLGLVLTQRLARLHGGDVSFTSVEGQGSQFTLLLPPNPPGTALSTAPTAPQRRLALVVEAVPQFLSSLTERLSGLGYRTAIARSGTEALEKIRRLQPAVVFLNPVLPLLSGWDVLVLTKADPQTQHIPVVVTATQSEKRQAARNQANGFISLPIDGNALQQTLDRVCPGDLAGGGAVKLTVLHLCAHSADTVGRSTLPTDLSTLLHPHPCRILEIDDLEQADLLARVWKPDVILVDGTLSSPTELPETEANAAAIAYFKQLSQQPFLSALPLVTLTPELTQAANQIPSLAVFPCLAALNPEANGASPLLQVLQVAAGIHWTPHLLLVDLDLLPAKAQPLATSGETTDWLHTAAHYLQAAGLRTTRSGTWAEVLHHLHQHSVDLLLLRGHLSQLQPALLQALQRVAQLQPQLPILVQAADRADSLSMPEPIAAQVLPASLTLPELLNQIQSVLRLR